MNILDADYIIEMPDRSVWKLPVRTIALSRARHYVKEGMFPSITLSMHDTALVFENDDSQIEDWAKNNMNWSEVEDEVSCVNHAEIDYQDGWCNGNVVIDPDDRDGM